MPQIKKISGQYPAKLTGMITFTGVVTGTFAVGETVTGGTSGMTAKVVKWNSTTKELTVKGINKDPSSAETITSASGSAAVATITADTTAGLATNVGGWNLRVTDVGVTRTKKVGNRTVGNTVEVLVASSKLATYRADVAAVPTFTLAGTFGGDTAGTYDRSAGDVVTFTIGSSEAVKLAGTVTYGITVGGVSRTASWVSSNAAGTEHYFEYAPIEGATPTGDDGTDLTIAAVSGNFGLTSGSIYDVVGSTTTQLTAPVAVTATITSKTAVTIQA